MKTVLITGFEPFADYKVNPSWEAVRLLNRVSAEEDLRICLRTVCVPVSYERVNTLVPELWEEYEPDIVIHVGVSSIATSIDMETNANRSGYLNCDSNGFLIDGGICPFKGDENIRTEFDVEAVKREAKDYDVDLNISDNAHRYLCEYIYYVSLNIDRSRTLFLHVPKLRSSHGAAEFAFRIKIIIMLLLKQMENKDRYRSSFWRSIDTEKKLACINDVDTESNSEYNETDKNMKLNVR